MSSSLSSLRAKMAQRKRAREGIEAAIGKDDAAVDSPTKKAKTTVSQGSTLSTATTSTTPVSSLRKDSEQIKADPEVDKKVKLALCDINLELPCNATVIKESTEKSLGRPVLLSAIEDSLQKLASQQSLTISLNDTPEPGKSKMVLKFIDIDKLSVSGKSEQRAKKRKHESNDAEDPESKKPKEDKTDLESLLSVQSAKERESKKINEEILSLLSTPTAKEQVLVKKFKSQGGAQLKEFCQYGTREECNKLNESKEPCERLHFRKIINKHTDETLGDCSFLNTCFHMDTCKYVHYEIDYPAKKDQAAKRDPSLSNPASDVQMFPPQWIQCDLRHFDMKVLGKCAVVMADPPWDIHMELPYGTMQDDEMRRLDVPGLQDDGFIFLWVTGRAMELGRECLELWGYKRIDELIWVKTNQLQRIIRTGRTGHWLNHGKEHCLVGVKGNPKGANRGLDCDVLVAEVRATSHKPDEIYGIIERLSPGTRKVELFGRPHNVQPNWITLGNQVEGVRLKDPDIVTRFKEKYPDGNCLEPPKK
ncbi:hypothetical protein FSP39_016781 [Pinctada imbricata]|uniref:mRNA m(6)A methyltransferase n=1 Tax=Pinctada imbricata TaxID=66713 RepID=A0AA88XJD9_PINIB|nr:hypothetical protein FSP39_016781 [Pinctada imbricata]